jgi:hypothetical protein
VAAAILLQSYMASRGQTEQSVTSPDWPTVDSTDEASDDFRRSSGRGGRSRHSRVSGR